MSGNDWRHKNVFSRRRKEKIDGDNWTWTGKVFQTMEAATGNKRWPTVVRRYDGTSSWSVDDDRRRRRLGRSDTGTSLFRYTGAIPCSVSGLLCSASASKLDLPSATGHQLAVRCYWLSDRRAFFVAGPTTSNSLQRDTRVILLTSASPLDVSCRCFLFSEYYCILQVRGFSAIMCWINWRFTYLLTYLLLRQKMFLYPSLILTLISLILKTGAQTDVTDAHTAIRPVIPGSHL